MGEIRKGGKDAGVRWDLPYESAFPGALGFASSPVGCRYCDIAGGPKKKLGKDARADHEERNKSPTHERDRAFGERDPKQREERSRVVKKNHPFGGTPGEQVLQQDRQGDDEPVWPEERQGQEGQKQPPEQVALEGLRKGGEDALRLGERLEQDVSRGRAQPVVKRQVIN